MIGNGEFKPTLDWPTNGTIQLNDLSLRYNPNDQPVLKNIQCTIQSKEKVND